MTRRIALVGAGRIGQVHAANAAAHPGLTLAAIVDPDHAAASAIAARTGVARMTFDAVVADSGIEGVIIASPTGQHLDQTLAAVAAGKAVFCEKPIDLDLGRVRAAACALAGAQLLVGFNRRFDPHFASLKAQLEAGAVGAVETLHITSHDPAPPPIGYVRTSGGLFKDMAIHDLDMARWLLGEEPAEVFAVAANLIDPAIGAAGDFDTAKILLRTAGGRMAVISNSRRSGYGYDQRIEAFGSGGMARAGNVTVAQVEAWGEGGATASPLQNFFLTRYADAYGRELDHFADVLAGAAPMVGYADGVAALALAEAAAESARLGKVVRV